MRLALALLSGLYFVLQGAPAIQTADAAGSAIRSTVVAPIVVDDDPDGDGVRAQGFRSGRRTYRPPAGGVAGGGRAGIAPGAGRRPGGAAPAAPRTGIGGFLGGMLAGTLAGTLLGGLLNPFGFGGAGFGGASLLGLIFWAVIIYLAFRLIRGAFRRGRQS